MTAPIERAHAAARRVELRRGVHRLVVLVVVVVAVRATVGVWPAAVLGGVAFTLELVALLAAIGPRPERPPPVPARRPAGDRGPRATRPRPELDGRHVEFARGLAGVAAWYLTECEREAQR